MQRLFTLVSLTALTALGLAARPDAQTHFYDLTQSYTDAYGGPSQTAAFGLGVLGLLGLTLRARRVARA